MDKPVRIGITCDHETIVDRRGAESPRLVLGQAYVDAIQCAGADPILLPHLHPERAAGLLDILDGLVISGGDFDVPPEYYGEQPLAGLGKLQPRRSAFEHALLKEAMVRDMPVLGICGGMQLINVVFGGTLFQDLALRPNTHNHQQAHDKRQPDHPITIAAESRLAAIVGALALDVNSTHHQVLKGVGKGLHASGVAPDGVVEAIEHPGYRFLIGVQWHPESLESPQHAALYRALVEAAARSKIE